MADYVGGVLGFASTMYNNHYAAQREAEARSENSRYNEIAAQNADLRTRALFNDLYSPQAQMEQLKEAGLSPSMFYSGGTAGGQGHAGAQGAGSSGISPNIFPIDPVGMAQVDLLKAEAKKADAEGERIRGEGKMGEADYELIMSNIGMQNSVTELNNIGTKLQEMTLGDNVQRAHWEVRKLRGETAAMLATAKEKNLHVEMDREAWEEVGNYASLTAVNMMMQILYTNSHINLNEQQINYLENEMQVDIFNALMHGHEVEIKFEELDQYIQRNDAEIKQIGESIAQKWKALGLEKLGITANMIENMTRIGLDVGTMFFLVKGQPVRGEKGLKAAIGEGLMNGTKPKVGVTGGRLGIKNRVSAFEKFQRQHAFPYME